MQFFFFFFFVQWPSGNSRSSGGVLRRGAVAGRHETVVVRYAGGRADVKHGRIHFGVKFLYPDPGRGGEGRGGSGQETQD